MTVTERQRVMDHNQASGGAYAHPYDRLDGAGGFWPHWCAAVYSRIARTAQREKAARGFCCKAGQLNAEATRADAMPSPLEGYFCLFSSRPKAMIFAKSRIFAGSKPLSVLGHFER